MQRYFIYLSYDGTAYHGWQIQPNGVSIQECLNRALNTILNEGISVTGAGRTDTGVHARLMVAHFDTENEINCERFADKLNRVLPPDIAINKIEKVRNDAHARFSAISRTYKYYISTSKYPFGRNYQWNLRFAPNIELMNKAAELLLECTDFTSFCKLHSDNKTNICHISVAHWEQLDDNRLVFTIQADRFLRNMVRAIVGTLVDVGRNKISIEDFRRIIFEKDRCKAGSSAPAEGLFLYNIAYDEDIKEAETKAGTSNKKAE
ncbi:MAG: tRNA pseudouridine(38-40) synthase TruA [Bacteroidales bacterium]|nr:tRNA pseudouridine(38-40) synthase TruA [Bacteroidales bacterium]